MAHFKLLSGAAAAMLGATTIIVPATASAEAPPRDGSDTTRAAASCWQIKQDNPAAPDGDYWLQTDAGTAPEQYYCDMTTDGGGWVLVGRGREGWNWRYNGEGNARSVREQITGPEAFKPRYLSTPEITGLLGGQRVDELPDGVRLNRAANAAGTAWQDVRMNYSDRDRWSWTMEAIHPLSSCTFDGQAGSGTTRDCRVSNSNKRLFTYYWNQHGNQAGFSYGNGVEGSNNDSSYLFEDGTESNAIPFTQVFIRPQVSNDAVAGLDLSGGLPAETVQARVSDKPEKMNWGVTETLGNPNVELNTEVHAMKQVGSYMYVGGWFKNVQHGAGGEKIDQPYLAAFDVETGDWISSFRPKLNGPVRDIEALPNGGVAVAGEFTSVNGDSKYSGLVGLDPNTGDVLPNWGIRIENRSSNPDRSLAVRALDIQDGYLYFGGDFTNSVDFVGVRPDGSNVEQTLVRLGRMWVGDRYEVDWNWRPNVAGGVIDLDASPDGERVHIAGYFLEVNFQPMRNAGILSTEAGAPTVPDQYPFLPSREQSRTYQQAILETNGHVFLGGSEHNLWMSDPKTFELQRGSIHVQGGDIQAIGEADGVLYVGGHFRNITYQDAYEWPNPTSFGQADGTNWMEAYDAQTGEFMPDFFPSWTSPRKRGPWAITADTNGCIWAGADFSEGAGGDWLGSFAKFCPRDTTAPDTPGNLAVTPTTDGAEITFDKGEDGARYEVLAGDRVVASAWGNRITLPAPTETTTYRVRAIDAEGNISATSDAVEVSVQDVGDQDVVDMSAAQWQWHYGDVVATSADDQQLVAGDQPWAWRYDSAPLDPAWNQPGFDTSTWGTGSGEFGYGDGDEDTLLPAGSTPRVPAAQFVTTFDVTDPAAYDWVKLQLLRDDGAVVYLNGKEVTRSNMPLGDVTETTLAVEGFWKRDLETEKHQIDIDPNDLVPGTNTLAVSVHQAGRYSEDLSFWADLTAGAVQEAPVPWNAVGFDDSGWALGSGHFGFGDGDETTVIDNAVDPQGISAQFRTKVDLANVSNVSSMTLNVIADDGAMIYVNGVEVGRVRMPAGPVDLNTGAAVAIWGADERTALPIEIPGSVLVEGENTIAISVHNDSRNGKDLSFEVPSLLLARG